MICSSIQAAVMLPRNVWSPTETSSDPASHADFALKLGMHGKQQYAIYVLIVKRLFVRPYARKVSWQLYGLDIPGDSIDDVQSLAI